MSDRDETARPRRPAKRTRRLLLKGLLVLVVLLALLWVFRVRLFSGLLGELVTDALEDRFGGRFAIETIEGSYLGDLRVVGLSTEEEGRGLRRIAFTSARLDFDLLAILGGDPLTAIRELRVDDLELVLEVDRFPEAAARSEGDDGSSPEDILRALPRPFPEIAVDGAIEIVARGRSRGRAAVALRARGTRIELAIGETTNEELPSGWTIGPFDLALSSPDENQIALESSGRLGPLVVETLTAALNERTLEGRLAAEVAEGRIEVEARDERLSLAIEALDLARLRDLAKEALGIDTKDWPRAGRLDLRGSGRDVLAPTRALELESAALTGVAWRGFEELRVAATGRLVAAEIEDFRLEVRVRDDELRLGVDARLPETRDWRAISGAGVVDLKVADAAELIARSGIELPTIAGRIEAHATFDGSPAAPEAALSLRVDGPGYADYGGRELALEAGWADDVVMIEMLRLTAAEGAITASGRVLPGTKRLEGMNFSAHLPRLSALGGGGEGPRFEGSLDLEGRLDGDFAGGWGGLEGRVNAHGRELEIDDFALGTLTADAALADGVVEIEGLRMNGRDLEIEGKGRAALTEDGPRDLKAEARFSTRSLEELARRFPSLPPIRGALGLTVDYSQPRLDDLDGLDLDAKLVGRGLYLGSLPRFDLEFDAAYDPKRGVELEVVAAGDEGFGLNLEAEADYDDGAISLAIAEAQLSMDGRDLSLAEPLSIRHGRGDALIVPESRFAVLGGSVTVGGGLGADESLDFHLRAEDLDLGGFHDLVAGRLDRIEVEAGGTLDDPMLDLHLVARRLRVADEELDIDFAARQDDGGLVLDPIEIESSMGRVSGALELPLRLSRTGLAWGDEEKIAGRLEGEVVPRRLRALKLIPAAVDAESITIAATVGGGRLIAKGAVESPSYALEDQVLRLEGVQTIEARLDAEALEIALGLDATDLIELHLDARLEADLDRRELAAWRERLLSADASGHLEFAIANGGRAADFIPDLQRLAGRFEGALDLSGRVDDPAIRGRISANDLAFRVEGLPGIAIKDLAIELADRRARIASFAGELGYSPFAMSGEASWADESPVVDLAISGKNVLLLRDRFTRARADLDLELRGAIEALALSGSVTITDLLYSEPISLTRVQAPRADSAFQLFSVRTEPWSAMTFDLDVRAKESIALANDLVSGRLSCDLHIGGTARLPEPRGRVYFRALTVELPFSRLRFERGEVTFDADDPFAPKIDLSGGTRLRGYEVNLRISGTTGEPRVDVASRPPLQRDQALVLLTTGSTPAELEDQGLATATLTRAGTLVGRSLIDEIAGPSDPDQSSFLDRFSLEIGRDVSREGKATVEAELRMTEDLFLRLERDRFEEYNLGLVWRFVLP